MDQTKINRWAARAPEWELKNVIRALDTKLGLLLNTDEDIARIGAARRELAKRKVAA